MNRNDFKNDYRVSHESEQHSINYEKLVTEGEYHAVLWEWEQTKVRELMAKYEITDDSRALDFACGTGRITRLVRSVCGSVLGVDISESMVNRALESISDVEYVVGDVTRDETLVTGKFDLITSFRFFLNAQDELRNSALSFISSKLDKEGIFIFNIHLQSTSIQNKLLRINWRFRGEEPLPQLSIKHMEALLQSHGLEIVRTFHFGVLPASKRISLPHSLRKRLENSFGRSEIFRPLARDVICICKKMD